MRMSAKEFRNWDNRGITLLGMSGVGKTRLATVLRVQDWFHYSGDYRIGTRYLDEPILDNIKRQAMQVPFLRDLLLSDSIYISNNITVNHLKPLSSFLGKLGDPAQGGLDLVEFKRRQELHRQAEIAAMKDVPEFIRKAHEIYGYQHFINDAGGSVCELDDPEVIKVLAEHTMIIYIRATEKDQTELIRRSISDPKPLYYREEFLNHQLEIFLAERKLASTAQILPDDFVRWIFPHLFRSRLPRYEALAREYGYTLTTDQVAAISSEAEFLDQVAGLLE